MQNIQCGVPEGSILGPLLVLIYINDIINSSSVPSFIMFADDTNVVFSHNNLLELIHTLNLELIKISSWFKCNKLSLNINKTNFIHFQTSYLDNETQYKIKIDDLLLESKTHIKFLGIIIDKHLTWNQHVCYITSLIAKGIGILYKTKSVLKITTFSCYVV